MAIAGELVTEGWSSGPVLYADRFADRWRGLRPAPGRWGMLLAGRSVHSLGMRCLLQVIGIDAGGRVIGSRVLVPGRVAGWRQARFILELAAAADPPPGGALLRWVGGPRPSDPLRHADRQPG